jgi:branched-chain amino acid transport system permease protein
MATNATVEEPLPRTRVRRPSGIGLLGLAAVALFFVWLGVNASKGPSDAYRVFLIGLTTGAIYGLIAIGYSLVYGILELINFAHGDVFMLGGMMTSTMIGVLSLSAATVWYARWGGVLLILLIAMAFCGILNAATERIAYRRLRHAPRLAPLITAIGMSFIFECVGLIWKGSRPVSVPNVLPTSSAFTISGVAYTWDKLIVLIVTVPVLVALVWLVQYTRRGKAMRAVAQDRDAAAMMGIDVDGTISFTFAVAGVLAGAAGVLFALYFTNLGFLTGFRIGLIAFTAAVLGGIGNLPGALLGGLLIGFVQAFNEGLTWHAAGADWTEAVVFAILILILVFRPEGILGERTPEGG